MEGKQTNQEFANVPLINHMFFGFISYGATVNQAISYFILHTSIYKGCSWLPASKQSDTEALPDFPGGSDGKESTCQCRRLRLDP